MTIHHQKSKLQQESLAAGRKYVVCCQCGLHVARKESTEVKEWKVKSKGYRRCQECTKDPIPMADCMRSTDTGWKTTMRKNEYLAWQQKSYLKLKATIKQEKV